MMQHERYESRRIAKLGIRVWGMMARELWDARELAARLFIRNFTARYKQSLLGYAWAVIVPFVAIATFVVLARAGIVVIGATDVPYPLFALMGLATYQLLSTGLTASCTALVEAGDMIAKVNFPREVLVIAAIGQAVFEWAVKMALVAGLCILYQYVPPAGALLIPLILLPLVILALGLGLLLALVHAVFRDTAQALGVVMTFVMFLTPVLYPSTGERAALFGMNPLTPFIEAPRDLLVYGVMHDPVAWALASAGAVLTGLIGWRIFHVAEAKIPERL